MTNQTDFALVVRELLGYDKMGNWEWWQSPTNASPVSRTINAANEYTAVGADSLTYDLNGNLTNYTHNTYVYDWLDRLIEVRSNAQSVATYSYDALNRRTTKYVAASAETNTYYYLDAEVVGEYVNGASTREFIYGHRVDTPVAMFSGSSTNYYLADWRGNVKTVTDTAAAVVERYKYSLFGVTEIYDGGGSPVAVSAIGNPYQFGSRRVDEESGLMHHRNRAYHAPLGRFLQRDPAGFVDGLNLYAYALNNPLLYRDPYGLSADGDAISDMIFSQTAAIQAYREAYRQAKKQVYQEALTDRVERYDEAQEQGWPKSYLQSRGLYENPIPEGYTYEDLMEHPRYDLIQPHYPGAEIGIFESWHEPTLLKMGGVVLPTFNYCNARENGRQQRAYVDWLINGSVADEKTRRDMEARGFDPEDRGSAGDYWQDRADRAVELEEERLEKKQVVKTIAGVWVSVCGSVISGGVPHNAGLFAATAIRSGTSVVSTLATNPDASAQDLWISAVTGGVSGGADWGLDEAFTTWKFTGTVADVTKATISAGASGGVGAHMRGEDVWKGTWQTGLAAGAAASATAWIPGEGLGWDALRGSVSGAVSAGVHAAYEAEEWNWEICQTALNAGWQSGITSLIGSWVAQQAAQAAKENTARYAANGGFDAPTAPPPPTNLAQPPMPTSDPVPRGDDPTSGFLEPGAGGSAGRQSGSARYDYTPLSWYIETPPAGPAPTTSVPTYFEAGGRYYKLGYPAPVYGLSDKWIRVAREVSAFEAEYGVSPAEAWEIIRATGAIPMEHWPTDRWDHVGISTQSWSQVLGPHARDIMGLTIGFGLSVPVGAASYGMMVWGPPVLSAIESSGATGWAWATRGSQWIAAGSSTLATCYPTATSVVVGGYSACYLYKAWEDREFLGMALSWDCGTGVHSLMHAGGNLYAAGRGVYAGALAALRPQQWTPGAGWQGPATPRRGFWLGAEANSGFQLSDATADVAGVPRGTVIRFVEGTPDLPSKLTTEVSGLTGWHADDKTLIVRHLAEKFGMTQADVLDWLAAENLAAHHFKGLVVQFPDATLHGAVHHTGGASALRALRGGN